MLAQRLRRWANINPTLVQRLVFIEMWLASDVSMIVRYHIDELMINDACDITRSEIVKIKKCPHL